MNLRKVIASGLLVLLGVFFCLGPVRTESRLNLQFLQQLQRDSAKYFWEQVNPVNGLIKDSSEQYAPCSIGAVGFGLVSLCIMEKNGWRSREEVLQRLTRTLRFLRDRVQHERGFFYHFVSMRNGQRVWKSEASSIDTALVVAGALFAGEYFKNSEIERLAKEIYERVDWAWMMNGGDLMSMGYTPEGGFLPYRWDSYNECLLLYALAIGSPTYPVAEKAWHSFRRPVTQSMAGPMVYCRTGSLFVYQYPHAFLDFRHLNDGGINYWKNSVKATLANRYFCIQNKSAFKTYDDNVWGLTASLGPDGYKGYGAEPADEPLHDGTVSPCAVAGSLPFTPKLAMDALMTMHSRYGKKVYGNYGFYDAFNVEKDWWSNVYIGINQGITVMMIENLTEHTIWAYFMKIPAVRKWADVCMTSPPTRRKVLARGERKTIAAVRALAPWH